MHTKKQPKKLKSYKFGILAEKIAMIFLTVKGYKILKWRYKSYFGEIDIIAKRFGIIVFIEVKARKSKIDKEEVLRPSQIIRIKKSAEFFVANNKKYQNYSFRFDYIEVDHFLLPKHYSNFIS